VMGITWYQGFPLRMFSTSLTHKKMVGLIILSQLRPRGHKDLTALACTYEKKLVGCITKYSLPLRDPIALELPITSA